MKALLRFLPASWRERYGGELQALLKGSAHPVGDSLDVFALVVRLRLEETVTWLQPLGIVMLVVGAYALGYAVSDLAHGWREVHQHWWSSAPLLLFVTGAAVTIATLAVPRLKRRA